LPSLAAAQTAAYQNSAKLGLGSAGFEAKHWLDELARRRPAWKMRWTSRWRSTAAQGAKMLELTSATWSSTRKPGAARLLSCCHGSWAAHEGRVLI